MVSLSFILGMMLTDYTFMDDNNPKYIDDEDHGKLVNLQRIQLIGAKMREFSNYQNNSYKSILEFVEQNDYI